MAASKPVKWSVGGSEPEDLPDFLSNDEILEKHGKPPRGTIFRMRLNKVTVTTNKNDDQMLVISSVVDEKGKGDKAKWNGLFVMTNQNVNEQGAPYLKKFLQALGATWDDFVSKSRITKDGSDEVLSKVGSINLAGAKPVHALATVRFRPYGDEERSDIGRWIVPKDEEESDDGDEPDEDEDESDDGVEMGDDEESEPEDDEEDTGEDELRAELKPLPVAKLRRRVLANDEDADTAGLKKPGLIDLIVEQELGDEEDEEEDEEDEDDGEAELREELNDLGLPALKKRCKDNGRKLSEYKGLKKPALIDMVVEDELEEDEDEEDEPPF